MLEHSEADCAFNRGGVAALSDLESDCWRALFPILERDQTEFLIQESTFRSPDYKWPRDPLHTWSRIWEYPYVFWWLRRWRESFASVTTPSVVDFGSGVTFFPFSVAKLGFRVICADIDPTVQRDLSLAIGRVAHLPGEISFRRCNTRQLPFSEGEVDIVYSVSVLEHIPNCEETVSEIARVLRPGGLFALTFDLDLRGDQEIGVEQYIRLRAALDAHFELCVPERTVHPAGMLRSDNGIYPVRGVNGWRLPGHLLRQWAIKPLLGRKPRSARSPFLLSAMGLVLRKRT